MELDAGEVIGQYRVESVLGQGGMAIVYRVRHEQLGSEHALKLLMVHSKSIQARLLQEGRVQATLRHANIVSVTDVVSVGRSMGLVMELVKGPTLEDLLAGSELKLAQLDMLAQGILEGVVVAHRQGLIHRDLKPANILLEIGHGRITPKVTDFGLAKLLDSESATTQTRSGIAMGTPHYMAPEQIRDAKNVDARTDVFALGAILYEMASGRKAFPGEDMLTIFSSIVDGQPTPIRELCPDLPEHMFSAIEGALAVDRENRIQSTQELLSLWKDEDLTDPGLGTGDPWTDDLMAKAVAISSPDRALPSVPSMDTVEDSQDTWAAPSERGFSSNPTQAPLSTEENSEFAGGGTWTDEYQEPAAFEEPAPKETSNSGMLKALGLGVVLVAVVGGIAFNQLKPGGDGPEEPVFEATPAAAPAPAEAAAVTPEADKPPAARIETPSVTPAIPAPASTSGKTSKPRAKKTADRKPSTDRPATPPAATPSAPTPQVETTPVVTPKPAPTPKRRTAKVEKPRKPSGPPPGKAWLRLDPSGDVVPVYVRSGRADYKPGDDIPAGTYSLQAFFKEGTPKDVGTVTLKSGDVKRLKCTAALVSCVVR